MPKTLYCYFSQVGDFGLSKIKRNTLVSGGVRGTLPWMAPELLNGSSNKVSEKVSMTLTISFSGMAKKLIVEKKLTPYGERVVGRERESRKQFKIKMYVGIEQGAL